MKIIVRTKLENSYITNRINKKLIGKMYKPLHKSAVGYALSGGWICTNGNYRHATDSEIKAFNNGIRHIKDVKNEIYKIY